MKIKDLNKKRESRDSLLNTNINDKPIIINNEEFEDLSQFIKVNYGINLKEEKKSLVMGRLRRVLNEKGMTSFTEYYKYISNDITGKAASELINRISTNHTYFMRERKHFDYYKDEVLPYLHETVTNKDLRTWSAGCSTGEEPYTLAMLVDEYFGREKVFWNTQILATDISSDVLDVGKRGIYSNKAISSIPYDMRSKYFKKADNENIEIIDRIKKEVIFARLNLINESFPFKKKFHTIYCRNVMIYFDRQTKMDLVNKFYDMTEYGGFLFIGHSETLIRSETDYKYIMPAVYRKI